MSNLNQGSRSYGLKYQARCIVSQGANKQHSRFLVGTLSLREENEVHLIQVGPQGGEVTCEGLFSHPHEIWDLAASPYDTQLFSTVFASSGEVGAAIWKMSEDGTLSQAAQIKSQDSPIKGLLWYPSGRHEKLVSLDDATIMVWSFDESSKVAIPTETKGRLPPGSHQQLSCGAWDPHNINSVAVAGDTSVTCWDLRTLQRSTVIEHAHVMQVRDVDYDGQQPHLMATAGDDSRIRFWDWRKPGLAFAELAGHSHWVWRARYNPMHSSLLLSGGTDSRVHLWQVPGSSRDTSAEEPKAPLETYSEHEDSVYGVAWSSCDPWTFASLSYDGRVVVDSVPEAWRGRATR